MPKQLAKKKQRARTNDRQDATIQTLRIKKGASLSAIYAAARRAFTATDLQRYTENEDGMPARQLLAELQALDRQQMKKRKRKSSNGRTR